MEEDRLQGRELWTVSPRRTYSRASDVNWSQVLLWQFESVLSMDLATRIRRRLEPGSVVAVRK